MKKFYLIIVCILSLIIGSIYGYENPERMSIIKILLKKKFTPKVIKETGPLQKAAANSYNIKFSKIIALNERTAFIVHESEKIYFDVSSLKIL